MRRNGPKRKLANIINSFIFKLFNLNYGEKIVLIGTVFAFFSLRSPWITKIGENEKIMEFNGFSQRVGYPGFIIMIIIFIIIFNLFSKSNKEKLRLYSNINFNNNSVYFWSGLIMIIISIICFNFIGGLQIESSTIDNSYGPIVCLTGGLAIIIGGFISSKNKNENLNTYINDSEEQGFNKANQEANNMKLPF